MIFYHGPHQCHEDMTVSFWPPITKVMSRHNQLTIRKMIQKTFTETSVIRLANLSPMDLSLRSITFDFSACLPHWPWASPTSTMHVSIYSRLTVSSVPDSCLPITATTNTKQLHHFTFTLTFTKTRLMPVVDTITFGLHILTLQASMDLAILPPLVL